MKTKSLILVVGLTLTTSFTFGSSAHVQTASGPTIAILPMVSDTDPKWDSLKGPASDGVASFLKKEFTKRKFNILPDDAVAAALKDQNVNLADPDQRDRKTLFLLGEKLHADYIVLTDLVDIDRHNAILSAVLRDVQVVAQLKVWFLDVKNHDPIIRSKTFESKIDGIDSKGSDLVGDCMSHALTEGFKQFFKTHPIPKD